MSPEELDKAKWDEEAWRIWTVTPNNTAAEPTLIAARLAREGWTPPDPISPRVMAAREWLKPHRHLSRHPDIDRGAHDSDMMCQAFLAGFAAAVKLAEPLVRYLEDAGFAERARTTYRQSIGEGQ